MIRTLSMAVLAVALFSACGKSESSSSSSSGGGSSSSSSKYGTPEDTAKAFMAACGKADWKAVGEACSKTAEGIAEFRDGKLSENEKKEIPPAFGAAKIGATTKAADGKTASVKFTAMDEGKERGGSLEMVLEGSDWKVTDLK